MFPLKRVLKLSASPQTGQEFIWLYRGRTARQSQYRIGVKSRAALFFPPTDNRWLGRGATGKFRAWILGMLESLSPKMRRLRYLIKAHKFALGQTAHRRAPEPPRRTPRRFFSTVNAVAKHFCYDFLPRRKCTWKPCVCFLARAFVSIRRMFASESGLGRLRMSRRLTRN